MKKCPFLFPPILVALFLVASPDVTLGQFQANGTFESCFQGSMYTIQEVTLQSESFEEFEEVIYLFKGTLVWGWSPEPETQDGVELIYRITYGEGNPAAIIDWDREDLIGKTFEVEISVESGEILALKL